MIEPTKIVCIDDFEPHIGAEAMWKGTPVIGGNVGGIRYQIQDGKNGFLVSSVKEAAERIVRLVKDKELNRTMGERARETVRKNFLLSGAVERYLDLFNSFETSYHIARKK
jgi:trehalose synthase